MRTRSQILRFLLGSVTMLTCASSLLAQVDRARSEPHANFNKYYNQMISHAKSDKRKEALEASDEMARALNAIYQFSQPAVSALKDGDLDDLASDANDFIRAIEEFRDKGVYLQRKLQDLTQSYSSELSAVESAKSKIDSTFNELWRNLVTEGQRIKAEHEAMKKACMAGCLN